MEAARAEKKRLEEQKSSGQVEVTLPKTAIIREYLSNKTTQSEQRQGSEETKDESQVRETGSEHSLLCSLESDPSSYTETSQLINVSKSPQNTLDCTRASSAITRPHVNKPNELSSDHPPLVRKLNVIEGKTQHNKQESVNEKLFSSCSVGHNERSRSPSYCSERDSIQISNSSSNLLKSKSSEDCRAALDFRQTPEMRKVDNRTIIQPLETDQISKFDSPEGHSAAIKQYESCGVLIKGKVHNSIVKESSVDMRNYLKPSLSKKIDNSKQVTFTNSQNVGITSKLTYGENKGKPCILTSDFKKLTSIMPTNVTTENVLLSEQQPLTRLKYTSSLKLPKKNTHKASKNFESPHASKSLSTDSLHNLELIDDDEGSGEAGEATAFKSKKVVRRKEHAIQDNKATDKNADSVVCRPAHFSSQVATKGNELKTLIISIGDDEPMYRSTTVDSTSTLRTPATQPIHSNIKPSFASDSKFRMKEAVLIDVNECQRKDVLFTPKAVSIKDEIEPIPRPERTQSVRTKTRRRSGKKSSSRSRTKQQHSESDSVDNTMESLGYKNLDNEPEVSLNKIDPPVLISMPCWPIASLFVACSIGSTSKLISALSVLSFAFVAEVKSLNSSF